MEPIGPGPFRQFFPYLFRFLNEKRVFVSRCRQFLINCRGDPQGRPRAGLRPAPTMWCEMKKFLILSIAAVFLIDCGGAPKQAGNYEKSSKKSAKKHAVRSGANSDLEDIIYDSLGRKRSSGIHYSRSNVFQDSKFDIPITDNERVQKWIDYFTGRGSDSFARYLTRSGRFIPYIHAVLKEYGLPKDIVYLSMIESGFNNRARSWAAAAGPWQFIRSTGALYGLEADYYVDERLDVEKATRAAARHLKDLYDEFGDWYLAFAAYNAGAGKVRNAINRHGTNFWDMCEGSYLRAETKDYVPKILAAAIISKNPEKYGFRDIEYQVPIDFERVKINSATDLEVAARCAGVDEDLVRLLNPELLRDMTPPNVSEYELKIPRGTKGRFLKKYAALSPAQRMNAIEVVVDKHDSASEIAARYGISEGNLAAANPGKVDVYKTKETRKVAFRGKRGKVKYRRQTITVAHYRVDPGTKLTIPKNRGISYGGSSSDDAAAQMAKREFGINVASLEEEPTKPGKKDKKNKKKQKGEATLAKLVEEKEDWRTKDLSASSEREDLVATPSNAKSDLDPSLYDHYGEPSSPPEAGAAPRATLAQNTPMNFNDRPEGVVSPPAPEPSQAAPSNDPMKAEVENVQQQPVRDGLALEGDSGPHQADANAPAEDDAPFPSKKGEASPSSAGKLATKPTFHIVKKGETLTAIANKYGVSVNDLKKWNGKKVTPFPKTGMKIQVGEGKKSAVNTGKAPIQEKTAREQIPTKQKNGNTLAAGKSSSKKTTAKVVKYKVKPGDNLTKIAQRHDTTPQAIQKLNGLKTQKVLPGAILIVNNRK